MADKGALEAMLDVFGKNVVEAAQRNLGADRQVGGRKRRAVASGKLKDSLTFKRLVRYGNPMVTFTTKTAETKKYADVVEYGRRPNRKPPPVEAILDWMRIKPVRLRKPGGGFIKVTEAGKRSAAYAIARSIGKRGIPGVFYFNDAVQSELEKAGPQFILALQKEIELRLNLK